MNLRGMLNLALMLCAGFAQAELKSLTVAEVDRIQAQYQGRNSLVVLWSVDCPPCHGELAMLGQLLKVQPDLPVTLIATDESLPSSDITAVLERHGLTQADNWQFADPVPARLRAAIDPGWYGELPRSYLLAADGTSRTHSGVLSEAAVRDWFERR